MTPEETPVVEPVTEAPAEEAGSVLDRILHRDTHTEPVAVDDNGCLNCANHGVKTKLEDNVCPACEYVAPRY